MEKTQTSWVTLSLYVPCGSFFHSLSLSLTFLCWLFLSLSCGSLSLLSHGSVSVFLCLLFLSSCPFVFLHVYVVAPLSLSHSLHYFIINLSFHLFISYLIQFFSAVLHTPAYFHFHLSSFNVSLKPIRLPASFISPPSRQSSTSVY